MQGFHINSFSAAVLLSVLFMGVFGAFVLIPIALIEWTWNVLMTKFFLAPAINAWQSILLYLAGSTILYLSGLIQIEIKTEPID